MFIRTITFCTLLFLSANIPASEQVASPPKEILLFDLHGVLFDTNYPAAVVKGFLALPLIIPHALYNFFWRYPGNLRAVVDAFAIPASCQTPRRATWEAIKAIPKDLYTLYLFSNIEQGSLRRLMKRYPDLFDQFKEKFYRSSKNNFASKTSESTISLVKEKIQQDTRNSSQSTITYFDDQLEHQDCARQNRWRFIHVHSDQQCAQAIQNKIEQSDIYALSA